MAKTNKQKAISAINTEGSFNTGEKRSLRNALDYTFDEISSGGGFDPSKLTITRTATGGATTFTFQYDGVDTGAAFTAAQILSADSDNDLTVDPVDGGLFYDDGA
jgi:hypothetical protein